MNNIYCLDFQILPLQMPQKFQDEEKSKESEMDQSVPCKSWQGYDCGV